MPVHQFLLSPSSSSTALCLSLTARRFRLRRCQTATDAPQQSLLLLIKVNLPLKSYIEDLLLLILAISHEVFESLVNLMNRTSLSCSAARDATSQTPLGLSCAYTRTQNPTAITTDKCSASCSLSALKHCPVATSSRISVPPAPDHLAPT